MKPATIIDGREIANKLKINIADEVSQLKTTPGLAVILVGDNPASKLYVRNKIIACNKVGINSFEFYLEKAISEEDLIRQIDFLNKNEDVQEYVCKAISSAFYIATMDYAKRNNIELPNWKKWDLQFVNII